MTARHPLVEEELRWLGADDPADAQAETLRKLETLVNEQRGTKATTKDDGWSFAQLLSHFADIELLMGHRYRRVLSEDEPRIEPFDPEQRAAGLHYGEDDPKTSLETFRALRTANLALWRRASPAERERCGVHPERGAESYDLMFRMTAGHDRIHLAQIASLANAGPRG